MTTFASACPVSLSRKPLSPGTEATSKTDLSLSRSLVHRQTWRLTGVMGNTSLHMMNLSYPSPVLPSAGDHVTVSQASTDDVLLSFDGTNTKQNVYIDSSLDRETTVRTGELQCRMLS